MVKLTITDMWWLWNLHGVLTPVVMSVVFYFYLWRCNLSSKTQSWPLPQAFQMKIKTCNIQPTSYQVKHTHSSISLSLATIPCLIELRLGTEWFYTLNCCHSWKAQLIATNTRANAYDPSAIVTKKQYKRLLMFGKTYSTQ